MNEREDLIRGILKSLPEDVPSLAWRSDLNEKIRAESVRLRRRRKFGLIFAPSLTFAVSACAAFFVLASHPSSLSPVNPGIEDALYLTHEQDLGQVADASLTFSESESYADSVPTRNSWTDNDLEGI